MLKKFIPPILLVGTLLSFRSYDTVHEGSLEGGERPGTAHRMLKALAGTYQYAGGIYNGKAEKPSGGYTLQRKYDKMTYTGLFIEKGEQTLIYEKGNYRLAQDTCFETQTYSSQPSKVTGVTLHYQYQLRHDTLSFKGVLPNGTTVLEYWKKVKGNLL